MVEKCIELLEKKKSLMKNILENTKEQEKKIQKENLKEEKDDEILQQLLEEREQLIKQIDEIQEKLQSIGNLKEPEEKVTNLNQDIQDMIKNIYEINIKNKIYIEEMHKEIGKKIEQINISKKNINNGYFKPSIQVDSYYIDKKK